MSLSRFGEIKPLDVVDDLVKDVKSSDNKPKTESKPEAQTEKAEEEIVPPEPKRDIFAYTTLLAFLPVSFTLDFMRDVSIFSLFFLIFNFLSKKESLTKKFHMT